MRSGGADAIASVLVVVVSAAIAVGLIFAMATGDKLAAMLGVTAHAEGRATYDGIFRVLAILSLIAVIWSAVTAFFVVAC